MKYLLFTISIGIFLGVGFLLFQATPAQAATAVWTNTGGDGLWSDCANWSGGTGTGGCPGTSDIATFNASSTASSTIDASTSVAGINLANGYTGTVTQNPGVVLTVGSSNFVLASGTFAGGDSTSTINGNFTQSGGTFTGGSGAITINGSYTLSRGTFTSTTNTTTGMSITGNFTVSGTPTFNANSGIVTFSGGNTQTLSCNNIAFTSSKGVVINKSPSGNRDFTVGSNCNLTLGASPTATILSNGLTLSGTLSGTGTLTVSSAGILYLNSGASLSGFNGLAANGGLTIQGATVDFSSYTSGVTLQSNFTFSSGSFTAPPTLTFSGGNSPVLSCGNVTFNTVVINMSVGNRNITVGSDCNLPLGASPTITLATYGLILNGTLSGSGTLTIAGEGNGIYLNSGATLSGFTGIVASGGFTNQGATTNLGSYTTVDLNSNFTLSSGTFTAPSGTMTVAVDFTISGGTFNANGGAITFDGSSNMNLSCGPATLGTVGVNKNSSTYTITATSSCTTGNFTLTQGTIANPSSAYTLFVTGDFAQNANTIFGGANLTVQFSGSATQNISKTTGTFSSIFQVNKTGASAKLTSNFTVSGQPCTIVAGTFDLGGKQFTCSVGFTINAGGVLQSNGPGTNITPPGIYSLNAFSGSPSTASIAWATYIQADTKVNYGTTPSMGTIVSDVTVTTSHLVNLSNLSPSTTYYYVVTSVDSGGDSASSTQSTFATPAISTLNSFTIEAENFTTKSGVTTLNNITASNGQDIQFTDTVGYISTTFSVTSTSNYLISPYAYNSGNSLYLSIDGGANQTITGYSSNNNRWVYVSGIVVNLTAGSHTLKILAKTSPNQIDQVVIHQLDSNLDSYPYQLYTNPANPSATWDTSRAVSENATGYRTYRGEIYWDEIEPLPGIYQWGMTDAMSSAIRSINSNWTWDVTLEYATALRYGPAWASPAGPYGSAQVARYGNFVYKAVQHLGTQKTVYEIINEPDDGLAAADYTNLLQSAYTKAKQANSQATVLFGGLMNGANQTWPQQVFNAGGLGYFDEMNIHPYTGYLRSFEEEGTIWALDQFSSFLRNNGIDPSKTWWTEYSASRRNQDCCHLQARSVSRQTLWGLKLGYSLRRMIPYWEAGNDLAPGGVRTDAGNAFYFTENNFNSAVFKSSLPLLPPDVDGLLFTRTSDQILAVFSLDSQSQSITIRGLSSVTLYDYQGNQQIANLTNGALTLTVTGDVQYLVISSSDQPYTVGYNYGTNFAAASNGATVAVSSAKSGNPASYIIDGIKDGRDTTDDYQWMDNTPGVFPDTAEIDFSGSQTIDTVIIYTHSNNSSPGSLRDFNLQYWDGSSWQTNEAVTGNYNYWVLKYQFTPVSTSKIRLVINNVNEGLNNSCCGGGAWDLQNLYSRLYEVQAYDAASADNTPPVRSNGQPTSTLSADTTQTAISLTTDENATCRYATTAGTPYGSMANTFSTTGGVSHSTMVTGLSSGTQDYYVRCQDVAGNANADDFAITFTVALWPYGGGGYKPISSYSPPAPPAGGYSVSINGNAQETYSKNVSLTLQCGSNVAFARFSEKPDFPEGYEVSCVSQTESFPLTLSAGDGTKTVYVKFCNQWDVCSDPVSDSIIYRQQGEVPAGQVANLPSSQPSIPFSGPASISGQATTTITGIPSGFTFTRGLVLGQSNNEEVKYLQIFLKAQGTDIYPESLVTGNFGQLTFAAVSRFQLKENIVPSSDYPGAGYVGLKTRAKINEILNAGVQANRPAGQATTSISEPTVPKGQEPTQGAALGFHFVRPLMFGLRRSADVINLQTALKTDPTIYPEGLVTGYFGSMTLRAVEKFQKKYGIASPGIPGYGYVGPETRAKLNELHGSK